MTSGIDLRTIGADLRLAHRFRESVQTKGRRYLLEGRLTIHLVSDVAIEATVRGQGHLYRLGYAPGREWWCDCPARGRCAHLVALQLVTVVSDGSDIGTGGGG